MSEVLFKNFKVVDNDAKVQDEIAALESACYLTIDQFNSNGQKDLDVLIKYGVKNIPKNINQISFNASGTTHRTHTHRGWDYQYSGEMKELWPTRQAIMRNTVDEVFDFGEGEKKQERLGSNYRCLSCFGLAPLLGNTSVPQGWTGR